MSSHPHPHPQPSSSQSHHQPPATHSQLKRRESGQYIYAYQPHGQPHPHQHPHHPQQQAYAGYYAIPPQPQGLPQGYEQYHPHSHPQPHPHPQAQPQAASKRYSKEQAQPLGYPQQRPPPATNLPNQPQSYPAKKRLSQANLAQLSIQVPPTVNAFPPSSYKPAPPALGVDISPSDQGRQNYPPGAVQSQAQQPAPPGTQGYYAPPRAQHLIHHQQRPARPPSAATIRTADIPFAFTFPSHADSSPASSHSHLPHSAHEGIPQIVTMHAIQSYGPNSPATPWDLLPETGSGGRKHHPPLSEQGSVSSLRKNAHLLRLKKQGSSISKQPAVEHSSPEVGSPETLNSVIIGVKTSPSVGQLSQFSRAHSQGAEEEVDRGYFKDLSEAENVHQSGAGLVSRTDSLTLASVGRGSSLEPPSLRHTAGTASTTTLGSTGSQHSTPSESNSNLNVAATPKPSKSKFKKFGSAFMAKLNEKPVNKDSKYAGLATEGEWATAAGSAASGRTGRGGAQASKKDVGIVYGPKVKEKEEERALERKDKKDRKDRKGKLASVNEEGETSSLARSSLSRSEPRGKRSEEVRKGDEGGMEYLTEGMRRVDMGKNGEAVPLRVPVKSSFMRLREPDSSASIGSEGRSYTPSIRSQSSGAYGSTRGDLSSERGESFSDRSPLYHHIMTPQGYPVPVQYVHPAYAMPYHPGMPAPHGQEPGSYPPYMVPTAYLPPDHSGYAPPPHHAMSQQYAPPPSHAMPQQYAYMPHPHAPPPAMHPYSPPTTSRPDFIAASMIPPNIPVYLPHSSVHAPPQAHPSTSGTMTSNASEASGSVRGSRSGKHPRHQPSKEMIFPLPPGRKDDERSLGSSRGNLQTGNSENGSRSHIGPVPPSAKRSNFAPKWAQADNDSPVQGYFLDEQKKDTSHEEEAKPLADRRFSAMSEAFGGAPAGRRAVFQETEPWSRRGSSAKESSVSSERSERLNSTDSEAGEGNGALTESFSTDIMDDMIDELNIRSERRKKPRSKQVGDEDPQFRQSPGLLAIPDIAGNAKNHHRPIASRHHSDYGPERSSEDFRAIAMELSGGKVAPQRNSFTPQPQKSSLSIDDIVRKHTSLTPGAFGRQTPSPAPHVTESDSRESIAAMLRRSSMLLDHLEKSGTDVDHKVAGDLARHQTRMSVDSRISSASHTASSRRGDAASVTSLSSWNAVKRMTGPSETVEVALARYLKSRRLNRLITLSRPKQAGQILSLAEVGDPNGYPVLVYLGLGCVRHLIALFDEIAEANGIRLLCIDRWGLGKSAEVPHEKRGLLEWAEVVREVMDQLHIDSFGILAHSAGTPYAMATALRLKERVIGMLHLLAPWVSLEVDGSYKWLKYVPAGVIKTAQATEWKLQGWMLGKLPSLPSEGIGYDASRRRTHRSSGIYGPWEEPDEEAEDLMSPALPPKEFAGGSIRSSLPPPPFYPQRSQSVPALPEKPSYDFEPPRATSSRGLGKMMNAVSRLSSAPLAGPATNSPILSRKSSNHRLSRISGTRAQSPSDTGYSHGREASVDSSFAPSTMVGAPSLSRQSTPSAHPPLHPAATAPRKLQDEASFVTALLQASHAEALNGGTADLLAILGKDSKPWGFSYTDIKHPCRIWLGERDDKIGEKGVRWMEREMKDCKAQIVVGAGHNLMTDARTILTVFESIQRDAEAWHKSLL